MEHSACEKLVAFHLERSAYCWELTLLEHSAFEQLVLLEHLALDDLAWPPPAMLAAGGLEEEEVLVHRMQSPGLLLHAPEHIKALRSSI